LPAFPEFNFRMSGEVRNKPQVPIIHLTHRFAVPPPLKGRVGVLAFCSGRNHRTALRDQRWRFQRFARNDEILVRCAKTNNAETKTNIRREQALPVPGLTELPAVPERRNGQAHSLRCILSFCHGSLHRIKPKDSSFRDVTNRQALASKRTFSKRSGELPQALRQLPCSYSFSL